VNYLVHALFIEKLEKSIYTKLCETLYPGENLFNLTHTPFTVHLDFERYSLYLLLLLAFFDTA
jgi:hypothetical protein